MATFTDTNKSSAPTFINQIKGGKGWTYDEARLTYDGDIDPTSGNRVYYDSVGTEPSWSNAGKSSAPTFSNQNKS